MTNRDFNLRETLRRHRAADARARRRVGLVVRLWPLFVLAAILAAVCAAAEKGCSP